MDLRKDDDIIIKEALRGVMPDKAVAQALTGKCIHEGRIYLVAAGKAAGQMAGTVCSLSSVAGMAYLFGMDRMMTISVLPKSVTTAIGVAISEQAGYPGRA